MEWTNKVECVAPGGLHGPPYQQSCITLLRMPYLGVYLCAILSEHHKPWLLPFRVNHDAT